VVDYFGSPQWWKGWPLFYNGGVAGVAEDAAGDTVVPIRWCGLPK
jgi:hypothetical protein